MKCRDRLHELVKEEIEKKDSSTKEWKIAMESSFNRMDNELLWQLMVVDNPCSSKVVWWFPFMYSHFFLIIEKGEPSFHLFGFIMCHGATAARALKSLLEGILLSSEGEKLNSMNLLLYMAPIAVLFLIPSTLLMEENMVGITIALARDDIKIIFYLLFNSALAYCVNLTNFLVTKHTSALTLQVEKEIEERREISFHRVGISVAPPVSFQDIAASHGDSEEAFGVSP